MISIKPIIFNLVFLTLSLYSCSKAKEKLDFIPGIKKDSPEPLSFKKEETRTLKKFDFLKISEASNLSLNDSDTTIYRKDKIANINSDFSHNLAHHYLVKERDQLARGLFMYNLHQFDSKSSDIISDNDCKLSVHLRFRLADSIKNKILSESLKASFMIMMGDDRVLKLSAIKDPDDSLYLKNKSRYHFSSKYNLNREICNDLKKQRARISFLIDEYKMDSGILVNSNLKWNDYKTIILLEDERVDTYLVDRDIDRPSLFGALKKEIANISNSIPMVEYKELDNQETLRWIDFSSKDGFIFSRANYRKIVNAKRYWRKLEGNILGHDYLLPANINTVEFVVKGVLIKQFLELLLPEVDKVSFGAIYNSGVKGMNFEFRENNLKHFCPQYLVQTKSRKIIIDSLDQWKKIPIELDYNGKNDLLWSFDNINFRVKDNSLIINIKMNRSRERRLSIQLDTGPLLQEMSILKPRRVKQASNCTNSYENDLVKRKGYIEQEVSIQGFYY